MTPSSIPVVVVHPPPQPQVFPDADAVLTARLRAQVEYYFSYQNLCQDTYLQSLLTSTEHLGAVPTEIIASFPKVRKLYATSMGIYGRIPLADPRLIVRSLKGSHVVSVSADGRWISPLEIPDLQSVSQQSMTSSVGTPLPHHMDGSDGRPDPSSPGSSQNTSVSSFGMPVHPYPTNTNGKGRCTVIVRDLHPECTVEEILEVFTTESGPPKSARVDVGNTWYINFSTESEALAAVTVSWGKNMRGNPIRARLKTEAPLQMEPQIPSPRQHLIHPVHSYAPAVPYPYLMPQRPPAYSYSPHPPYPGMVPYVPVQHHMVPVEVLRMQQQRMEEHHYHMTHHQPPVRQVVVPDGLVPIGSPLTTSKRRKHKRHNKKRASHKEWRGGNEQQQVPAVFDKEHDPSSTTPIKKGPRKRHHQRSPKGLVDAEKQSLKEDDFPTLGGGEDTDKATSSRKLFGYAKALLNESTDPVCTLDLTAQMQNTSISSETE